MQSRTVDKRGFLQAVRQHRSLAPLLEIAAPPVPIFLNAAAAQLQPATLIDALDCAAGGATDARLSWSDVEGCLFAKEQPTTMYRRPPTVLHVGGESDDGVLASLSNVEGWGAQIAGRHATEGTFFFLARLSQRAPGLFLFFRE